MHQSMLLRHQYVKLSSRISLPGFFSRRISAMKRLIQAWKIPVSSTRRDQLRPNVSKRQKSAASRVAGMASIRIAVAAIMQSASVRAATATAR
jgi:hypothetical protein